MRRKKVTRKPKTILCPVHKQPLVLEEKADDRLVAVCTCDVEPNPYQGKAVYEKLPSK